MDSPPAKRRRTSPRLSGRSDEEAAAEAEAPPPPPPPAEAPPAETAQAQSKLPRPSFASPTRASLARHNPAILDRRESLPRTSQDGEGGDGGDDDNGGKEKTPASPVRPLAQPPMRSPVRSPARSVSPTTRALAMPPVRSPSRRASRSPSRSPTRRLFGSTGAGSLLGELPRRSPIKPVPRPLPPPDPQRSEDLLEPLMARDKQLRTGLDMFRVHEEPAPEPELPPTPSHASPDLTTSPPGIHNQPLSSTPSKRPRRVGRLRGAKAKHSNSSSSPLKQPPVQGAVQHGSEPSATALKEANGNVPRRGPPQKNAPPPEPAPAPAPALAPVMRDTRYSSVRNIQLADPDAAKKKERDRVVAEIAALEADLALAAAENARLREAADEQSGSAAATTAIASTAPNARDIVDLLRRRALPEGGNDDDDERTREEAVAADWLQMAANPIAFLPFGKPRADVAEVVQLFAAGAQADAQADAHEPPPVSHHPIAMAAEDELPFLQAFTPLAFRSQVFADEALQRHVITATSTAPAGVFAARIEMAVHATSLAVVDLQVPRIEPAAARIELQPLLDLILVHSKTASSSALERNAAVLLWALGEWVRVGVRRAKFWARLARLLRDKGAGMAEAVGALASRGKSASTSVGAADPMAVSKREVLEHMGRTGMDVDLPQLLRGTAQGQTQSQTPPGVRVEWDIDFDWTGEATSKMRLLVGVPGKWRKADKKGSVGRLPRVFAQLVQDGGDPMRAVQTVVALLAGGQ